MSEYMYAGREMTDADYERQSFKVDARTDTAMVVTVQVKTVYGNDLVYPMDDTAILFVKLINAKTFNHAQLQTIKALGYEINVASGQLPFAL